MGSPWGVTYLTKARQVTQMSSAACYKPLALCLGTILQFCIYAASSHILTHTSREMLYGLCYLQTNLHISFHHQSDVSPQQGTTFAELLLSPEIRNAM